MYVHTYTCSKSHIHTYAYNYTHMHTRIRSCTYTHTPRQPGVRIRMYVKALYTCTHVVIMYIYALCIYIIHTCKRIYILYILPNAYTYTRANTYTFFFYLKMCSLTVECVLLPQSVFSYCRMCSLTTQTHIHASSRH